jgi:hypothetical protein
VREKVDERARIAFRHHPTHVRLAAQFDRHRETRERYRSSERRMRAPQMVVELPPHAADGLVERCAAAVLREQRGACADQARERLALRPVRLLAIQVHHGLVVAMQVEHDIGIARERGQRPAQRRQFVRHRQRRDVRAQ